MRRLLWSLALVGMLVLHAGEAHAQQAPAADAPDRIAPLLPDTAILTTKHDQSPGDIKQPEMPAGVAPFQQVQPDLSAGTPAAPFKVPAPVAAPATAGQQPATFQPKIPFGRGEAATLKPVPSGPHKTEAVPVVTVDSVEASEPAPPTPIAPEADPVQENPAEPTELTSPIFEEEEANRLAPRKLILRALNKVTAQSAQVSLKPGEKIVFGQLEITGVTCQTSAPTSQTDHAALLEVVEKDPATHSTKLLFKGWMYASSPSVAALEHPIYDITLVECRMMPAAAKEEEKSDKSDKKPVVKVKH